MVRPLHSAFLSWIILFIFIFGHGRAQVSEQPLSLFVESGVNHSARTVIFSPNDKFVAASGIDRTIRVWRIADYREILAIPNDPDISTFAFHPTLPLLASHDANSETVRLWDLKDGKLLATLHCGASGRWHVIMFSADGARILHVSDEAHTIQTWDFRLQHRFPDLPINVSPRLNDLVFGQNGKLLAGLDERQYLRIVEVSSWHELSSLPDAYRDPGTFSLGLNHLARIVHQNEVEIWSSASWKSSLKRQITIPVEIPHALAFSAGDRLLACAQENGNITLFDVATGRERGRLASDSNRVEEAGWLAGSRTLGVKLWSNIAVKWPVKASQPSFADGASSLWEQGGLSTEITLATKSVLSAKGDRNSVKLRGDLDQELGTLVFLDKKHAWVMTTPDGRFDTNMNLDGVPGVHWVAGKDWLNPLPPEIFMRDYYTPNLFARVMAGEVLPHVVPPSDLNRTQPLLERPRAKPSSHGRVDITVRVSSQSSTTQKDSSGRYLKAGVYDVRLFRDGQLAGEWPKDALDDNANAISTPNLSERDQWRKTHRVVLHGSGHSTILFRDIRIPQGKDIDQVRFTAYAFNADRVKSMMSPPLDYKVRVPKQPSPRKAYVIAMGVNATESSELWDLSVAVPSARRAAQLWKDRLTTAQYEVVPVNLMSELNTVGGFARSDATKGNLQAVLNLLGGRGHLVSPAVRKIVDKEHKLQPARPDDAVVLYIASHGYVDPRGNFFIIPFDTGTERGVDEALLTRCRRNTDGLSACKITENFLSHAISSDDLAKLWTGIDAGEMIMVLDSCHSGALPGQKFRPGPLGDRNFGQLAYDKGLQIFAATQPDKVARGTAVKGDATLLIEALDTATKTTVGQSISDWLQTAKRILPERAHQLYPLLNEDDLQWPELMDFRRRPSSDMAIIGDH
jgi:hypothetical protein